MYDCNNKSTKKQVNKTVANMESELASSLLAQMVKNLPIIRRPGFNPWVGKIPWRKEWQSTPVFLPGESHGQRSLTGYSPWGCRESDVTEQLTHCAWNRVVRLNKDSVVDVLHNLFCCYFCYKP